MFCTQIIEPEFKFDNIDEIDYVLYTLKDVFSDATLRKLKESGEEVRNECVLRVYRSGLIVEDKSLKEIWKPRSKKSCLKNIYYNRTPLYKTPLDIYVVSYIKNTYDYDLIHFIDNDDTNMDFDNLSFQATENQNANKDTGFIDVPGYAEFVIEINPDHYSDEAMDVFNVLEELPDVHIYSNGLVTDSNGKDIRKINREGYRIINKKGKRISVHQLVAKSFVPNPMGYSIVNHINGDRSDNHVNNLEWVNNTMNFVHMEVKNQLPGLTGVPKDSLSIIPYLKYSITSRNILDFVIRRLEIERNMPPEYWIFSNSEPFSVLFLILIKHGIFKNTEVPDFLKCSKFYTENSHYNRIIIMNDMANRHRSRNDEYCHILQILEELGVSLIDYLEWVIWELKYILKDDVGFVYAAEMKLYKGIMRTNDKGRIYQNTILDWSLPNRRLFEVEYKLRSDDLLDGCNAVSLNLILRKVAVNDLYHRLVEPIDFISEKGGAHRVVDCRKFRLNSYFNFWYIDVYDSYYAEMIDL